MADRERFLVRCKVSRGFFEGEFLVIIADSSAYVDRTNVRTDREPTKGDVDGLVSAYLIERKGDKALIELPGQAVVGGVRTWVPEDMLTAAVA